MNKSHPCLVVSLISVVSIQLTALSAHGALGFVSDRSTITPNQTIDWEDFGLEYDILNSPFAGQTSLGLGFSAYLPDINTTFSLLDQSSGWQGNFADGDHLLTTDFYQGPITLDFAEPIQGIAFQIQSDLYDDFTGVIEAFDSIGNSLGFFNFAGVSDDAADDSAITVGLLSDVSDIDRITVNIETGTLETFAINQVSLLGPVPAPLPVAVPETGGLVGAFALAGLSGLWLRRRHRQEAQV